MRLIQDIVDSVPAPKIPELDAPKYVRPKSDGSRVGLAVESMKRHMTDEGWQIFQGLEEAGYNLYGRDIHCSGYVDGLTNVEEIIHREQPSVVVMQDKREWEGMTADHSRDPRMRFTNVTALRQCNDIFKLTILKDAQHNPLYHRQSAEEIGCHAWIVYYNPRVMYHLASYIRLQHTIRVYHTIDPTLVPRYDDNRMGCIVSGAVGVAYPLRTRLIKDIRKLPNAVMLQHPGYHRKGCHTPEYLKILSTYKVAICTSSIYGYALRKIIEATACGCMVLTDLPYDELLPTIDHNLTRIPPDMPTADIADVIRSMIDEYDPGKQMTYAERAKLFYDYKAAGRRLAADIEHMRNTYRH